MTQDGEQAWDQIDSQIQRKAFDQEKIEERYQVDDPIEEVGFQE